VFCELFSGVCVCVAERRYLEGGIIKTKEFLERESLERETDRQTEKKETRKRTQRTSLNTQSMKNKTMRMAMSNCDVEPGATTIIAPVSSIFLTRTKHSSIE
jgi:hypothetical protein